MSTSRPGGPCPPIDEAQQRSLRWILRPFQAFFHAEASSGILLLACALVSLGLANSPLAEDFHHLLATEIRVGVGGIELAKSLEHWVNDGLMALFFLVVGLEIKREVLVGELSSLRPAALPVAAALGGMVVPALLYLAIAGGGPGAAGWGIPMATDIAFALGVLSLLGRRVPLSLKVFLTALAIVDDIGAVLVIVLFYTPHLSLPALGAAGAVLALLVGANWLNLRHPLLYALLGAALWLAVLKSGVHATIAGVLLAATIPVRARMDPKQYATRVRTCLASFEEAAKQGSGMVLIDHDMQAAIQGVESACEAVQTPLQRIEHRLVPWVSYGVMPIFALVNSAVDLRGGVLADALLSATSVGVVAGLFLGKPLGILAASYGAVRLGLAALPRGVTWRQIHAIGVLGGIGFTMSLFIAALGFGGGETLRAAKVGILAGSALSGLVGLLLLHGALRRVATSPET